MTDVTGTLLGGEMMITICMYCECIKAYAETPQMVITVSEMNV
jgi:hypothetical protein